MDTNSTTNSNDDQELAKVLEGMNQQVAGGAPAPSDDTSAAPVDGMAFEETPANASATTTSSENSEDSFAVSDFVSIYVGILNGVNPTPVELVEKLKKELG